MQPAQLTAIAVSNFHDWTHTPTRAFLNIPFDFKLQWRKEGNANNHVKVPCSSLLWLSCILFGSEAHSEERSLYFIMHRAAVSNIQHLNWTSLPIVQQHFTAKQGPLEHLP